MEFFRRHPFFKSIVALFTRVTVIIFTAAIIIFVLIFVFAATFSQDDYTHVLGKEISTNKILSLKVTGTIVGDSDDTFGDDKTTSGYVVKEQFYKAAKDDSIKAVMLEVNSPGGTIYGAQAIADGAAYYKEKTHKPVYAHIQGQGASGAYWAAVSADKIIADYGSDTGSIGVLMGPFKYYDKVLTDEGGVVTQNGVESINITAGTSKDMGNPYRRLTNEEIATLQRSVDNDYDLFVQHVSERRHIPAQEIRTHIGALAYDNKTAQDLKLIDQTGGREMAYHELAQTAGFSEENYEVIRPNASTDSSGTSWINSVLHRVPTKTAKGSCTLSRVNVAFYGDIQEACQSKN